MISKTEVAAALKMSSKQSIVLNGSRQWSFLDEYTFTEFKKDANSPSFSCEAEGIVIEDGKSNAARLAITEHKDLKACSAALYYLDAHGEVVRMVDVTKMEIQ